MKFKKNLLLFLIVFLITAGLYIPSANAQDEDCGATSTNFEDCFNSLEDNKLAGASDILRTARSIGGFLIILGGIIAAIAIVVAGIMWMAAGSNQTRVGNAKSIFKNGVIGALIVFAAGVVVNTVATIAYNPTGYF